MNIIAEAKQDIFNAVMTDVQNTIAKSALAILVNLHPDRPKYKAALDALEGE